MLRLPLEVAPLFRDWLATHYPLRAAHVMSIVRQIRGGKDNESRFGVRMGGQGEFADLIRKRFALACKRLGSQHRPRCAARRVALPAARRRIATRPLLAGRRRRGLPCAEAWRNISPHGPAEAVEVAPARLKEGA